MLSRDQLTLVLIGFNQYLLKMTLDSRLHGHIDNTDSLQIEWLVFIKIAGDYISFIDVVKSGILWYFCNAFVARKIRFHSFLAKINGRFCFEVYFLYKNKILISVWKSCLCFSFVIAYKVLKKNICCFVFIVNSLNRKSVYIFSIIDFLLRLLYYK